MKKHCITISLLFLLILCIVSCREKSGTPDMANTVDSVTPAFKKKAEPVVVDASLFVIFPYDSVSGVRFSYPNFVNCKPAKLTSGDLATIELLLTEYIGQYNAVHEEHYNNQKDTLPEGEALDINKFILDLKKYRRQYVPVINSKEQKEVWINCFCSYDNEDWHKKIVFVFDGGKCYFHLYINLSTRTYYGLNTNPIG